MPAEPCPSDAGAGTDIEHTTERIPPELDEMRDAGDQVLDVLWRVEASRGLDVEPREVASVERIVGHVMNIYDGRIAD